MFVLFLFGSRGGGGGAISIHEKNRGLRQHTICGTSLLHLVFPFLPTLIAVTECDVLWTQLVL